MSLTLRQSTVRVLQLFHSRIIFYRGKHRRKTTIRYMDSRYVVIEAAAR